jgi:hypothetical protein
VTRIRVNRHYHAAHEAMIRPAAVYCMRRTICVRRAGQQQYLSSTVLPFSHVAEPVSSGGTHATAVQSTRCHEPQCNHGCRLYIARVNRTVIVKLKSKRTGADLLGRVRIIGRCCVPATAPRNKLPARQSPRRTARSRQEPVGWCLPSAPNSFRRKTEALASKASVNAKLCGAGT